jgi:hypothetical protein
VQSENMVSEMTNETDCHDSDHCDSCHDLINANAMPEEQARDH